MKQKNESSYTNGLVSYTSRDYESLVDEFFELVPKLTDLWKPEADADLQKAADIIRQKGQGVILITGHTDSKGSDAYNQRLSLARAQAVKNWFEAQGLQQNYQLEGLGATRPIAPNTHPDGSDNPEGRAQNRRVEIIVNKTTQLGN